MQCRLGPQSRVKQPIVGEFGLLAGAIRRTPCFAGSAPTLAAVSLLLASSAAEADAIGVINGLRTSGCLATGGIGVPLEPNRALNEVARTLAQSGRLGDSLSNNAYRAASATSFHLRGSRNDETIAEVLGARHCEAINDPIYEQIGVFARQDEIWIVLAAPKPDLLSLEPESVAARVLALVNAARAEPRRCGRERLEAAPPLARSIALDSAAAEHARDMAARGDAGHRGSDGSQSSDRITRAGYPWRASGENVAAGQPDADAVVAAWLASPGHCKTLMGQQFTETGIAFALTPDPGADPSIYWAQVFAAPR